VTYFSRKPEVFNVTLWFDGDEVHSGTVKAVKIEFKRYPVSITLNGPSRVPLGRKARFSGSIQPAMDVPLTVYVNGKARMRIRSKNGTFSFELKPGKTGSFRVYVLFEGNELYDRAVSNTVLLDVVGSTNFFRYSAIALLVLAILLGLRFRRKPEERVTEAPEVHPVPEVEGAEELTVPEDVGEAYSLLRKLLRRRFSLETGLTPREVLKALREWELYPELEKVTLLHERAVYGGKRLSEK